MAFLLNLIWFIFGGGAISCLLWLLTGTILILTVVGIPFGYAAFRIAGFAAFPYGKELVDARHVGEERVVGTSLGNFLWIVLAGIWLAVSHLLAGISLCLTIIGIPFGIQHIKLAVIALAPVGMTVVESQDIRTGLQPGPRP